MYVCIFSGGWIESNEVWIPATHRDYLPAWLKSVTREAKPNSKSTGENFAMWKCGSGQRVVSSYRWFRECLDRACTAPAQMGRDDVIPLGRETRSIVVYFGFAVFHDHADLAVAGARTGQCSVSSK
jgi:hypothetical protein